jgi:multiple sugar transport system permease protein
MVRDNQAEASSQITNNLFINTQSRKIRKPIAFFPWLLMTPSALIVLLVTFFPIVQAIQLSMYQTIFLERGNYIGLDNFNKFFTSDIISIKNITNTLIFAFGSLALTFPIAISLALILSRNFRGRTVIRTILILPWVVSQLLSALMWRWVLSPDIGPIGYWLTFFAGFRFDTLGQVDTAMIGMIVTNVWRTYPYAMILTLAALTTIPKELFEAATVDGAGPWQRFIYVTFPMIQSTLLVVLIVLSVNAVNMIELPLILTGGGPVSTTELLGLRVYREAFVLHNLGYASSIAVVMFGMNALMSIGYIRVLRSEIST